MMGGASERRAWLLALLFVCVGCAVEVAGDSSADSAVKEFRQWFTKGGGKLRNAELAEIEGYGRGLVATRSLKNGTIVLRTPLSLVLSIEHAIVSDVGGIIEDWLPQDVHGMALYLCYERARGRDSPLHPYVNALPTAINTPLFWSVSERAHLKGTNAEEVTLQRERDLKEAYETLVEKVPGLFSVVFPDESAFTYEQFAWAASIVWSRNFRIRVKDGSGQWQSANCLVPMAGMLNTDVRGEDTVNTDCYTNERSTHFECHSIRNVSRNSQYFAAYSSASRTPSSRLLCDYGFVPLVNPNGAVWVPMPPIAPSESVDALPRRLLKALELQSGERIAVSGTQTEMIPLHMLAYARILTLSEHSRDSDYDSLLQTLSQNQSMDKAHEIASIELIMGLLQRIQEQLTSTIDAIHTMDSRSNINEVRVQMATRVRLEERDIIDALLVTVYAVAQHVTPHQDL